MIGELELYRLARRALLDALEALKDQRSALILVGAQAIYVQVGASSLPVAEFTKDADLAIEPSLLAQEPKLIDAMQSKGFRLQKDEGQKEKPGHWLLSSQGQEVVVDLIVPEAVSGGGRRGARLPYEHGKLAAQKARGLEGVLVDNHKRTIKALEESDTRSIEVRVAGVGALLVAKLHKIYERVEELKKSASRPQRLKDKDAYDVFRLLGVPEETKLSEKLATLSQHPISKDVTVKAISYLRTLFTNQQADGIKMLAGMLPSLSEEERDEQTNSCIALAEELLTKISK